MMAGNCRKSPKKMMFTPPNERAGFGGAKLAVQVFHHAAIQHGDLVDNQVLMFLPRFLLGGSQLAFPLPVRWFDGN
jgi:hypothetical protein